MDSGLAVRAQYLKSAGRRFKSVRGLQRIKGTNSNELAFLHYVEKRARP